MEITMLNANVAGLPIPMAFSSEHRFVPSAQKEFGALLNSSGADIVCVQEDFQYHALLKKEMKDYPYATFTSGGIPAGDGLNVFSKYPIYNIERVTWEVFNGILKNDNDGLTPKGFLKCTVDFDGVLVDVYNIHTDASRTMEDQLAKKAQLHQLCDYISKFSASRPVLITGDMNCALHVYPYAELYGTMIEGAGFSDAWAEVVNGGSYLQGEKGEKEIADYLEKYDGKFWGLWDSYERLLYRDGYGAAITPLEFEYSFYESSSGQYSLSDHAVMRCKFQIDASDYKSENLALREEKQKPLTERIVYYFKMVRRCLWLIIGDAFVQLKLLLTK